MILSTVLGALPGHAEPYRPTNDDQVLERLPQSWQGDTRLRELRRLRGELAQDGEDLDLALQLAHGYLEIGRSEADPRYLGYSQAALDPWWDLPQPPPGVLYVRALVHQNRHDFDTALEDLNRLVSQRPRHPRAWLNRAVIHLVRGDHLAARASCLPLRRLDPLMASACQASVGSLSGHAESSYAMLRQALASFPAAEVGDRLWVLTGLAEIAHRLGRPDDAELHFKNALALEQRDIYLLAAYADFLLDQDRPREVLVLLAGETRADALLLRRALAAVRLATPRAKDLVAILDARFAEGRLRGDSLHLGAESRFRLHLLNQPGAALRLALDNWAIQREPIDARHVLEAALAAGDREASQPVIDWLDRSGLEDMRLAA
ncbi:MAG: tetratricopeptide repeat protein, partial [Acidobacteriota bacterium]